MNTTSKQPLAEEAAGGDEDPIPAPSSSGGRITRV